MCGNVFDIWSAGLQYRDVWRSMKIDDGALLIYHGICPQNSGTQADGGTHSSEAVGENTMG
jgi:hypothetical protein